MSTIQLVGKSGKKYVYHFLDKPADARTIRAVAGNYAFLKKLANGNYAPIYFGQAEDLQSRIPNHDRWGDCVTAGATCVVAKTTPGGEKVRCDEERDLIAQWNPPLNVHHRNVG